jgi:signal transduction histidine kinase
MALNSVDSISNRPMDYPTNTPIYPRTGMTGWIKKLEQAPKPLIMATSLLLVAIIGAVDWVTGFELSFSVFYLIPVALAVWLVGDSFGIIVSVLSVAVWVAGDMTAGARYSRPFVPVWNAMITVAFLIVVVGILTSLRRLHKELEDRVRQRTIALTNEMQERTRLEQELLTISEREQRRIGHDLHDSLCQHLTGTALAGQVLGERLADKSLPEAAAAGHLVALVEEAIDLTRNLARGLHPTTLEGEGFLDGFRELAVNISERFKVSCELECNSTFPIQAPNGAIHLYRIAQEAITNAIKHGKAGNIVIHLERKADVLRLEIVDDGVGLPANARSTQGMGLRIMAYRASMVGASFNVERMPTRGTRVTCVLNLTSGSADTYATKTQSSVN